MARPTHCQEFYEIAIARDEATIATFSAEGKPVTEFLERLKVYRRELRWWIKKSRAESKPTKRVRAYDTGIIRHSAEQTDRFRSHCEQVGECQIFHPPEGGYHFFANSRYGKIKVSVRRFAYSIANPDDQVSEGEDVQTTCEHVGDFANGDGCCVFHLKKVPA